MPGLVGIVQASTGHVVHSIFETLVAPMRGKGRLQTEALIARDNQWALGRVHLGKLQESAQLSRDHSVQVLFHGDLVNAGDLRKQFELEIPIQSNDVGSLIKLMYGIYGSGFASRLQGSFCAAVLDESSKRLMLISDRFGAYPLYWFNGPHRFVFASKLKTVLCEPGAKFALDPRAVADYVTFGFLFGDKTLSPQVRLLPPASVLTYNWRDGTCKVESYSKLEEMFKPSLETPSQYLTEVTLAFNRSVRQSLLGNHNFTLSLSGGLDSRAILSAIDCSETPISTYTLGAKGCADEVIARDLAEIVGRPNRFLEMDTGYLTGGLENIRRMVRLTDGLYLTHGLTEMLVLNFLEETGFSVLLRGHGGELAKASLAWPLHTDEPIYQMQSKDEFVSYMLQRVNYVSRGVPLHGLFTAEWWLQIKDGARQSLEESIADVSLSPPDLCSYLYLTEHHRRFTIASLELFRHYVEVRMPFVDEEFLRVLFGSPPRWRDKTDIHRAIIGTNAPALLKVRNSNTGAPGDAGPFAEKLWDKMNSLFKRLNLYGYRHYHSFDQWMKQRLLESVERVLMHPRSLERGILREAGLGRLIGETKRGVADHAYLLQILLILELWQQEYEGGPGERE
jgi:asparagine synthase (glutamine-hydrolysing)